METTKISHTDLRQLVRHLMMTASIVAEPSDYQTLRKVYKEAVEAGYKPAHTHGIDPVARAMETCIALCEMVSPDRNMIIATLVYNLCSAGSLEVQYLERLWNTDVARLVTGLMKVSTLYGKQTVVKTDNFRRLLMALADDIRVIIIMIVDRLTLMRAINHHPDEKFVIDTAFEANYLYAPLAHRLGLYKIKSELEDMSLKYTARDTYTKIARELNETKATRDAYIASFIAPVREKLDKTGLKYEIKGRTKSIFSIWNKLRKQQVELSGIYDLFAIRIILDVPLEDEKAECWRVFSIITDMYTSNPKRLKDWLSIPKGNGYESLHTTVMGPDNKWVEVQIRTRRMDLVAEKGLAAHWKYKGIKSEESLDVWMNNVRDILETAETGPMELMKNMRMDFYDKEVFVFTPKGDLFKLPYGATVLDFAFHIHTKLGMSCTGAKVNGRNQKINYKLRSGDTVEIMTSAQQVPKIDWLAFVVTGKARNRIRQSIHEMENRASSLGKELLERRLKNRKIDLVEATLMKLIKKMGFRTVTDFFNAIAAEQLDINEVIEQYVAVDRPTETTPDKISAEEFQLQPTAPDDTRGSSDVLVIGEGIKGVNYRLSKCCNPIYGDEVFGFISSEGVIKIHRNDCPNAANIRSRYPYRLIPTRWSGKVGEQFGATLRIIGNDDIGIVTSITSIINKESSTTLRSISIDSNDGIFQGFLGVGVRDTAALNTLIKKLKTVKGVKDVQRSK